MGILRYVCVPILLALTACVETRPPSAHDVSQGTDAGADLLEIFTPADIPELRAELPPETVLVDFKEAEGNCHYDCLPGLRRWPEVNQVMPE